MPSEIHKITYSVFAAHLVFCVRLPVVSLFSATQKSKEGIWPKGVRTVPGVMQPVQWLRVA